METSFQILPLTGLNENDAQFITRINCLGSFYYFTKIALRRRRLTDSLHLPLCKSLERDHIKDVLEYPRDHFKSTIAVESRPMWGILPLSKRDLDFFSKLGYNDEFIKWLIRVHRPEVRNLAVSENITNAAKLGTRIRRHFESNPVFRSLFPEILPDSSCTWTNYSLQIKLPYGLSSIGGHGEGTFDFLGVGSALQSRHYNGLVIQDDLVGRKAVESPSIMEKTIEYHKILAGAFENEDRDHENNELVIGNRWAYSDMNSYIRENEPWFRFETHGALGGCCPRHPPNAPIFPEEFSFKKLEGLRKRLGSYNFSCQFLNNPAAPENADFKREWLNYFTFTEVNNERVIRHEVRDGVIRKDIRPQILAKAITTDPAHSSNASLGRCRHAIIVMGLASDGNYYLLDCWAQPCNYDVYIGKIYEMCDRWNMRRIGVETVAAQKFLAYHLEYRNRLEGRQLRIVDLKGEVEGPDGQITRKKEWRIRNILLPIFENYKFWIRRDLCSQFLEEYDPFPKGRYFDILDSLAYAPQLLKIPLSLAVQRDLLVANQRRAMEINQPYGVTVN